MNRRNFLKATLAGTALVALPISSINALPDPHYAHINFRDVNRNILARFNVPIEDVLKDEYKELKWTTEHVVSINTVEIDIDFLDEMRTIQLPIPHSFHMLTGDTVTLVFKGPMVKLN